MAYVKKSIANCFIVNGPVPIEESGVYTTKKDKHSLVLGWIGSPDTLYYLYKIYDALEIIGRSFPEVSLKIVGTGFDTKRIPIFESIKVVAVPEYNSNTMMQEINSFDIGLYPLFSNELSMGHGILKATLYMSAKVPVVSSPIGELVTLINHRNNGLLASSTNEWISNISELINDADFRKKLERWVLLLSNRGTALHLVLIN